MRGAWSLPSSWRPWKRSRSKRRQRRVAPWRTSARPGGAWRRPRERRELTDAGERERAERAAAAELRATRLSNRESAIAAELSEIPERAPAAPDAAPAADLAGLQQRADTVREKREQAATERDAARDGWLAAQAAAREVEERHLGAQRSHALQEARGIQLEATQSEQQALLARLAREGATLQPDLDAAREADQRAVADRQAAESEREAARAALVELERAAAGGGSQLAELEREMQAAAIEASRHEDAMAALARERQLALETLAAAEADAADASLDIDPALRAEISALAPDALEQELRRVRRTLSQIGSVNPFAVEEHRELSARLDELTTQDTDLSGAIGSTEELIAKLDADIAERFNAAFAAIAEHFDEFCRLLFAGGSASLSLGDGSDGEAPGWHRDRGAATRQAPAATGDAVGRGAGADRRGAPVRDAQREPRAVLHPGRGRRRAGRGQHRSLRRRAAPARAGDRLRGDHPQPSHDRGGGHDLRRDDERRRGLGRRLAAAGRSARGRRGVAVSGG